MPGWESLPTLNHTRDDHGTGARHTCSFTEGFSAPQCFADSLRVVDDDGLIERHNSAFQNSGEPLGDSRGVDKRRDMIPMMTGGVSHMDPIMAVVQGSADHWLALRTSMFNPGNYQAEGVAALHSPVAREEAALKVGLDRVPPANCAARSRYLTVACRPCSSSPTMRPSCEM